jgi:hypothetical protein
MHALLLHSLSENKEINMSEHKLVQHAISNIDN